MTSALSAVALTLAVYTALALSSLGWGAAAARLLRLTASGTTTLMWLGWAMTILIFQLLHCAVALNAFAAVPVFVAGIVFAAVRGLPKQGLLFPALVAIAAWIASRSMLAPAVYDAGLYHLNTIRWLNTFPIVPGLGNLHGRLAFNQSYFTWAAALNAVPHGSRMANGFLFLLALATLVARLRPVAVRPALLWESHPFEYLPSLFALPVLGYLAYSSPGLASPTADLASELVQLVMFVTFSAAIRRWVAREEVPIDDIALLAILGATAITMKLSNLVFAAVIIAIALTLGRLVRGVLRVGVLVMVILVVWMCRGYVTSGAPLYPSTLGYVAFDWAVPRAEIAQMATEIRGWAHAPHPHWKEAVRNRTWMSGWIQRMRLHNMAIIAPLRLGISFLAAACFFAVLKGPRRPREFMILLPVLGGLAYWFFTAPEPRFAHALFFCLAIAAALLFLASVQPLTSRPSFTLIVCAVFAVSYGGLALWSLRERRELARISLAGWQPIPIVRLLPRTTASGLVILTPAKGDQCWDAPLPCTPYFRDDLQMRVPGRLGAGFSVTPAVGFRESR